MINATLDRGGGLWPRGGRAGCRDVGDPHLWLDGKCARRLSSTMSDAIGGIHRRAGLLQESGSFS